MPRYLPYAFAAALFAASPLALAQTPSDNSSAPAATGEPAAAPADNSGTDQSNGTETPKPAKPAHHHAMHKRAPKSGSEVSETQGLNKLYAAGFSDIKDVKTEGGKVMANAQKDGKDVSVTVDPDGNVQTADASGSMGGSGAGQMGGAAGATPAMGAAPAPSPTPDTTGQPPATPDTGTPTGPAAGGH